MTELMTVSSLTIVDAHGQKLVDNASWTLAEGGRLGVIGESGSGKSLTALALLGLLPEGLVASGSIRYRGIELIGLRERQVRRFRGAGIAMVFQEPLTALDPLMKIGRQLSGPLRMHREMTRSQAAQEANQLLGRMGLTEVDRIADSFPWQLSGGQRQRVALALALACHPLLLIADEPTTALDVTVQARILDLLDEQVSVQGTALLFIGHDLPVVATLARDIVVMRAGRVIEYTTVDDALRGRGRNGEAPIHPYTAELIAAARASEGIGHGVSSSHRTLVKSGRAL